MKLVFSRVRLGLVATGCLLLGGCLLDTEHEGPWPCNSQNDCEDGTVCRTLTGSSSACVSRTACNVSDDCAYLGDAWFCASDTCFPPMCSDDSHCNGYPCLNHHCAFGCSANDECSDGYFCVDNTCMRRPCNGSAGECGGVACRDGFCPSRCDELIPCEPGLTCLPSGVCE